MIQKNPKLFIFLFLFFSLSLNIFSTTEKTDFQLARSGGSSYDVIYFYDLTNNSKSLKVGGNSSFSPIDFTSSYYRNSYKYYDYTNTQFDLNWLDSEICKLTIGTGKITANFDINGYKDSGAGETAQIETKLLNYLKNNGRDDILQKNLWMNASFTTNNGITKNYLIDDDGVTYDEIINLFNGENVYGVQSIYIEPIDLKCNFDNSIDGLGNNEKNNLTIDLTFPHLPNTKFLPNNNIV